MTFRKNAREPTADAKRAQGNIIKATAPMLQPSRDEVREISYVIRRIAGAINTITPAIRTITSGLRTITDPVKGVGAKRDPAIRRT
jgi:hypothetical protein